MVEVGNNQFQVKLTLFIPTASPQVAAPSLRDCTFEIDECDWINSRDPDRVDWERVSVQILSPRHQRKPYTSAPAISRRNDFFLGLGRLRSGPRAGSGGTAQLITREMKGSSDPLCVTFWYFMFESFIDASGPSLGLCFFFVYSGNISQGTLRILHLIEKYNTLFGIVVISLYRDCTGSHSASGRSFLKSYPNLAALQQSRTDVAFCTSQHKRTTRFHGHFRRHLGP